MGDALHAAGYNIRWLLRAIVRLGLKGLFLRLTAVGLAALVDAPLAVTVAKNQPRWSVARAGR